MTDSPPACAPAPVASPADGATSRAESPPEAAAVNEPAEGYVVQVQEAIDDDNDNEDGGDEVEELMLRVAELQAAQAQSEARHNFALHMAEQESHVLERYVQLKRDWLTARATQQAILMEETRALEASQQTWDNVARVSTWCYAEFSEQLAARAAWERDRLRRLADTQLAPSPSPVQIEETKDQTSRAMENALSRAYASAAATHTEDAGATASGQSEAARQLHEVRTAAEADLNIARLVETVSALMPRAERRAALQTVARQLRQVTLHTKEVAESCAALLQSVPAAQQRVRPMQQLATDWTLQRVQLQLQCVVRSRAPTERTLVERHLELDRHLARLRAAWATVMDVPSVPPSTTPQHAATVYADAQAAERELEAKYTSLVEQVIALRKWTTVSTGDGHGVTAFDLTLPAQITTPVTDSDVARVLRELSLTLLQACDAALVRLLRAALHEEPQRRASPRVDHDDEKDDDEEQAMASSADAASAAAVVDVSGTDAPPHLRLLSLQEATEWRHASLAALLAENVQLWQKLQDTALLVDAVPSEARTSAVQLLAQVHARQGWHETPSSLLAMQESVLALYRQRLEQLATLGTRFLAEWQAQCVCPVRELCKEVSVLLRLWHLVEDEELSRVHGDVTRATVPFQDLLRDLDAASSTQDDDTAATSTLTLPALPASVAQLRPAFDALTQRTRAAVRAAVAQNRACLDDPATRDALAVAQCSAEVSLEQLPALLAAAEAEQQRLRQAASALDERARRAQALQGQLAELRARNAATQTRIDECTATLVRCGAVDDTASRATSVAPQRTDDEADAARDDASRAESPLADEKDRLCGADAETVVESTDVVPLGEQTCEVLEADDDDDKEAVAAPDEVAAQVRTSPFYAGVGLNEEDEEEKINDDA